MLLQARSQHRSQVVSISQNVEQPHPLSGLCSYCSFEIMSAALMASKKTPPQFSNSFAEVSTKLKNLYLLHISSAYSSVTPLSVSP